MITSNTKYFRFNTQYILYQNLVILIPAKTVSNDVLQTYIAAGGDQNTDNTAEASHAAFKSPETINSMPIFT